MSGTSSDGLDCCDVELDIDLNQLPLGKINNNSLQKILHDMVNKK